jgi:UDP-3-O-[3-hydroxymyristoyl] glucosamine N-acyltransferase
MVGGSVQGDGQVKITGVNGLEEAQCGDLCFVRDTRYLDRLAKSKASAVLIKESPENVSAAVILVEHPDLAFAQILKYCEQLQTRHPKGIHESVSLGRDVVLGNDVGIGPHVTIADDCTIGDRVILYPGVYVGHGTTIGDDCVIYPNVTIRELTQIGARCIVHAGTAIGSDGFGFAPINGQWAKIPQIGCVVLEDDVEIGSNTTIDRATCGITRIGRGTKIDNLVQVGHNVEIGEHCALVAMVGIAGSTKIANNVRFGASSGVAGHIAIGEGATIGARAGVTQSIEPGKVVSGFPAIDHNLERRVMVAQKRLPELIRRVKQLEREIQALKDKTE